jgi:glycosyltransferase involved in cell wall biosynthesis
MSLLTIGIPTFNRKEIVKKNILNILSDNFLFDNDINLVVSDNGSTDDTFETLCDIQKQYKFGKKLKIIRNKKNLGFTKNIFELFGSSDTKYLLLTSDEDFIVKKNFYLLKNFLEEKKVTFVCSQIFHNGVRFQGKNYIRNLKSDEWNSGAHISGLVYDVEAVNVIISKYYDLLTDYHLYYIQNYLIAELMITHPYSQWFFDYPLIKKKFSEPTTISTNEKYPYWTVPGRWEGHFAEEKYFLSRYSNEISHHSKNLIMNFIKKNRFDIYKSFICAIEKNNPEMLSDFRSGMLQNEFGPLSYMANLLNVTKNFIFYIIKKIRNLVLSYFKN